MHEFFITEIIEIEDLGIIEDEVYDIGMIDTPHTFFANNILVHNSLILSISPLLEKLYPDYQSWDEKDLVDISLKEIKKIQEHINTYYTFYAYEMLKAKGDNFLEMKQELFAKAGIWLGMKKKYGLYVINEEGISVDKMVIKGLDNVRSDFPLAFRILMDDVLKLLLKKLYNKEQIISFIKEWYQIIKNKRDKDTILSLMFPTSVKEVSKYDTNIPFNRMKGTPIHVNSSLNYNDYLKYTKLKKYSPIVNQQKIKWTYLNSNEFKFNTIAINEDDFCENVFNFIIKHFDFNKNIESSLISKLQSYYDALDYGMVELEDNIAEQFFTF